MDSARLNDFARTKLRQWLRHRAAFFSGDAITLLVRISEFAALIQNEPHAAGRTVPGMEPRSRAQNDALSALSDALLRGVRGLPRDIAAKSVFETILYTTRMEVDLPSERFTRELRSFLRMHGARALIRRFLRLYLSNIIWFELHDIVQARVENERELRQVHREIQKIIVLAVNGATSGAVKWTQIHRNDAGELLSDIRTRMQALASALGPLSKAALSRYHH